MGRDRRQSRLSRGVQDELIQYFVAGATARSAAALSGVNRNTARVFFHKLPERITEKLPEEVPALVGGEVEE